MTGEAARETREPVPGGEPNDLILRMRHITKAFGEFKALDDVTFDVRRGEIHAVCGENGAGKSTLMNVLSGVWPRGTYEARSSMTATFANSAPSGIPRPWASSSSTRSWR